LAGSVEVLVSAGARISEVFSLLSLRIHGETLRKSQRAPTDSARIKAHWSKVLFTGRGSPPRALADSDQVRRLVAADPSTIGYLERSRVDASLKVVRIE
jgi:hypothetical protein